MPESEGAELVDGQIVELPMGSMSGWIGGILYASILQFVQTNRLGFVLPQENGLTIWPEQPNRVRKPDLMFVRRGRVPDGRVSQGWITVVPDLVVEVVSPRDLVEDLERKLTEYRDAGIPLIWVIYPATHSAHVLALGQPRIEIRSDDSLDGGDALPGFTCKLSDLFAAAEELQ